MALIEFSGIQHGYSDELIILEASGAIQPGNIIGLVGPNGGGKTTLLRLLLGELAPEQGRIQRSKAARVGYVSQASVGEDAAALFQFVRAGRDDLLVLEARLTELIERSAQHAGDARLMAELGEVEARFTALGGHQWDTETDRLLQGLSFSRQDYAKPLGQLSGGQRQKACLARVLLGNSNCLVFDEPTNHLDLQAQEFLAAYLKEKVARSRSGGVGEVQLGILLVSHDRWLLDALATHIWELDGGTLYRYPGNYSAYVPARDLRRKQALEAFTRQQEYIGRTEEYIRRNIAGQNTRQARGRRTLLGRMERLEKPGSDPSMQFVLEPQLRSGEQVLIVEDLEFEYGRDSGDSTKPGAESAPVYVPAGPQGLELNPPLPRNFNANPADRLVLRDLEFTVYRTERLGIVGPNGCGKTTLLKLLAKSLQPRAGMIAWGSNAELGVFSQDSADLGYGHDLMAELRSADGLITDSQAREYLARFGFSGDDVYAEVGSLSGGERSRLSLAKIFRRRPNVLLLDEPTNHLDIYAREALEQFLEAYQGTVLIVTHDRALLERLCDRLVVFSTDEAGGMRAQYFRGRYPEYLAWRERELARDQVSATAASTVQAPPSGPVTADTAAGLSLEQLTALAQQARTSIEGYLTKQQGKHDRRVAELEQQIEALEAQLTMLAGQQQRADSAGRYQDVMRLEHEMQEVRNQLEADFNLLAQAAGEVEAWEALARQVRSGQLA